jgi:dolichyl-phosphate beta-glucosyltransferase
LSPNLRQRPNRCRGPSSRPVVIPVYNETKRLGKSVPKLLEYFADQPYTYEFVIVDDGSTDGTADLARQLFSGVPNVRIIESRPNRGKGHGVKVGMLAARGDIALFSDADLSTPLSEIDKFWVWFDAGYKVVIGSRKMKGANIVRHQPLWRESLGKVFTWLTNRLATRDISDITCGFKCFTREAAHDLFKRSAIPDWSFDAEVLFIAQHRGYRVKEVPVSWHDTPGTKVRLWKDAVRSMIGLLRIRLNHIRGLYK